MLCELWYCETGDSRFEHHWARTVADLMGATVPVAKFGASDCKADCPSHFFHLPARPSTAVFRSQLSSQELSTPVSVEFIAESRGKQSRPAIRSEYFLGRRFLELRNRAIRHSDLEPAEWTSLAKRRTARQLAEDVAKEMTVSFPTLKRAIEFATAVEALIECCGETAWSVLFDPGRPQSRQAMQTVSRTSDVCQRHRIKGVVDGKFPSVAPHSDDTVFDTTRFGEVPSRLARARGSLEKLLARQMTPLDQQVVEEVRHLSRLCGMSAELLDECLTRGNSPVPALPLDLSKESVMTRVRSKAVRGWAVGKARQALRLTVKNVWDYEEMMRRGLEPTAHELQVTRSEIQRIREITSQIERQ